VGCEQTQAEIDQLAMSELPDDIQSSWSINVSQKLYLIVSGVVFLLVGVFHLFRLINHWTIVVGTADVSFLLSYIGCPVSIAYCLWACWLLRAGTTRQS